MKRLLLLLFPFLIIGCEDSGSSNQQNNLPNYIIIFCDDLGYGDLSVFGHPTIATPHLDKMAEEGQKWTQFYVADPVCTPSRAGLLTGRYPIRNGMTSNKRAVLFPDSGGGLPQSEITIAEVLKQKDYSTAAIGKWHLGHLPNYLPMEQGFDYYYGIPYSNDMDARNSMWGHYRNNIDDPDFRPNIEQFNVPLMEGKEIIERPAEQHTITQRYTDKAIEFIQNNRVNPFFLYLAHSMPHIPLFTSQDFKNGSKNGIYGDVIEEIDYNVGRILQTLNDLKLDDNTIVVFTSDNGPWLSFKTHGGSAGPLRAGKGTTFEGGQRVPTIFWGPGFVKPGVVSEMGSTLDIIQTFASLSSVSLSEDRKYDGYDLSGVLNGTTTSPRKEFHYWAFGELHAYRSGPWKLHIKQRKEVNYGQTIVMEGPELYHLEKDISEKYNILDANPEVGKQMQEAINVHLKDVEGAMPDQLALRIEKK
jgi:arylsulfatase A-like enzyme